MVGQVARRRIHDWLILPLVVLLVNVHILLPVTWFIDVTSIEVEDVAPGNVPAMSVDREIHRNFTGGYTVSIYNLTKQYGECSATVSGYSYRQTPRGLIEDKDLAWWAFGGTCTQEKIAGFKPGKYAVTTCHFVKYAFFMPVKKRCWEEAQFEVRPEPEMQIYWQRKDTQCQSLRICPTRHLLQR